MNTLNPNSSSLRLPALLLALSPLAFIGLIASAILFFAPNNIGEFTTITPQQMAAIRVGWIMSNLFLGIAILMGAGGTIALASTLRNTKARLFAWISLITALIAAGVGVVYVALRINMANFSEANLGLVSDYHLSEQLFSYAFPLLILSTLLASFGLYASGMLRRTGLAVGIVGILLLILSIVAGFPPFVVMFLWCALGVGLLRRKG